MNSLSPDLVRNMNSTFFSTITTDFPADFVTFTEESLMENFIFCAVNKIKRAICLSLFKNLVGFIVSFGSICLKKARTLSDVLV